MSKLFDRINNNEVYIIAEMSANHGGSLDNALKIVREVAKTGADCLKIQTYTADSITLNSDADDFIIKGGLWDKARLYDLYTGAGTPYEWQSEIKAECEKCGMDFLSTPFDPDAVDFLDAMGCDAYKIASFELVDIPLIKYTASKSMPMIISCGMGTVEEIQDAVDACLSVGNDKIVLLKCCSEYPANWDEMHVSNIPDMRERFKVPVGLSDHSSGSIASVVAVSMGACVIEKHVRLEGVESADSKFSMTMDEFAAMVSDVRNAKKIAGNVKYGKNPGEQGNWVLRRSLFVSASIKKGEIFTKDNIRSVRPATGLKTKYYEEVIGRKALRDLEYGDPLKADDIEGFEGRTGMSGVDECESTSDTSMDTVLSEDLYLRRATAKDCDLLFEWANDSAVRKNSFSSDPIPYENHVKWFEKIMADEFTCQYILMKNVIKADKSEEDIPVGQIRISLSEDKKEGLIGYSVASKERGQGLGKDLIDLAEVQLRIDVPSVERLVAKVKPENFASSKTFLNCGYSNISSEFVKDICS